MISCTVMATLIPTMVLIPLTLPQDVPTSMITSTLMALAFQAVLTHVKKNGMMDHTSVILLVLKGTLIFSPSLVLAVVKLKTSALKIIFCIVKVIPIQQIPTMAPTRQMTVLMVLAINILMAHASQAVIIHTEMNIMKESTYAILLVKTDTLMR